MLKISEKMAKFAEEYVKNGYNGAKAYGTAYSQDNKQVCASEAYKLLRDQRILEEIENVEGSFRIIGQAAGVDKKTIVGVLSEMLTANKMGKFGPEPDYTARKDAVTLFAKLTGDFKDKKELEISTKKDLSDIDPSSLSKEELLRLEKELLAEL